MPIILYAISFLRAWVFTALKLFNRVLKFTFHTTKKKDEEKKAHKNRMKKKIRKKSKKGDAEQKNE